MKITSALACGILLSLGSPKAFSIPPAQGTYSLCRAYNIGTEYFKKRIIDEVYYLVDKGDDYYIWKPYDFWLTLYTRIMGTHKYSTEELRFYTDYLCSNHPETFAETAFFIISDDYSHKYHMFQEINLSSYSSPSVLRIKKKFK